MVARTLGLPAGVQIQLSQGIHCMTCPQTNLKLDNTIHGILNSLEEIGYKSNEEKISCCDDISFPHGWVFCAFEYLYELGKGHRHIDILTLKSGKI